MPKCFVPNCKYYHKNQPKDVTMHRFPKGMKQAWLAALGQETDMEISRLSVICSIHFRNEDFESYGAYRRLKKGVIPSLHLGLQPKKLHFEPAGPSTGTGDNRGTPLLPLPQTSDTSDSNTDIAMATKKKKHIRQSKLITSVITKKKMELDSGKLSSDSSSPRPSTMPSPTKSISSSTERKRKLLKKFHTRSNLVSPANKRKKGDREGLSDSSPGPSKLTSPAKSVQSSVERKRRFLKAFHTYSHSPSYIIKSLNMERRKSALYRQQMEYSKRRTKRLKTKVTNLGIIIKDLRKMQALSENGLSYLEKSFSGIPLALMKRLLAKSSYGKKGKSTYPPELRSFAMTLQFYSPKAYEYVRKTFNHALPHQSVIRSWLSKIDCEPGFSSPAFIELKHKVVEHRRQNNSEVYCSLMLDEMAIKKQVEFDGTTTRGYVDFGADVINDENEEATEALVLMVVAINANWKLPVAYFLINKLTGDERAAIVQETLIRLHDTGIIVISLTCDGPQVHIKMMRSLGCNITDVQSRKTWFQHPVDQRKIYVIFDVCHMLKLVRNNWARLVTIKDPDGNLIDWTYIQKLHSLQENELFSLGNKLRRGHIQWQKQVMKVRLAAQTLSASVADALQFLDTDLNMEEFAGVAPTVRFIRLIDQLFDLLNSRNPFGKGFKAPLRLQNEIFWKDFFLNAIEYLMNCTTVDNIPLHRTPNKTPFIGFITSTASIIQICNDLLNQGLLKYILTYKFSQDHLELFFCSVRCRNGWNNNPTALQFIRTYKRLLLHHDIKNMSGNCLPLDSTNLLSVSSTTETLNCSDVAEKRKIGLETNVVEEDVLDLPITISLNDFCENVVTYISGFIVKMALKALHCEICADALEGDYESQDDSGFKLLQRKQRGGLRVPSKSVVAICRYVEIRIRNIYVSNDLKMPSAKEEYVKKIVLHSVQQFLLEPHIFPNLDQHVFDTAIGEETHKKKLIELIAKCYCRVRFFNLAKRYTEKIRGDAIRSSLNKLILFKHQ